jgi:hypothetical protein
MKLVKNFVFTVLLVSAIAVNTSAGEQDTPGFAPPPPPPAMRTTDEEITISNTEQGDITAEASDYLLLEALAALLSMY